MGISYPLSILLKFGSNQAALLPNFLTFTSEFSHLCFRIFSRYLPNFLTFASEFSPVIFRIFSPLPRFKH